MNAQDKDLPAFAEYLSALVKNSKESKPLTTEESVAILQNYGPPEEISSEEREKMIKLMKVAHKRRIEISWKMSNSGSIHSLGELLQLFSERKNISLLRLGHLLNITAEQLAAHREDRISPTKMGKERILNLAMLAGIGIQDMVAIIDRTITRMQSKTSGGTTEYFGEFADMRKMRRSHISEHASPSWEKGEAPGRAERSWQSLRTELLREAAENAHKIRQA
ncbi:MAG: hypothetical protein ACREOO_20220 [bacterium]